jgi:CheY-like chemotaxis protein
MVVVERRSGQDRRGGHRGGRRTADSSVHTPVVLLVASSGAIRTRAAAALENSGFAVAVCEGRDALQTAIAIVPEVVIADVADAIALRGRLPNGRRGAIPIVDLVTDVDLVCERVRAVFARATGQPPPGTFPTT